MKKTLKKSTDVHDQEIAKVDSNHACLAIFTIASTLQKRRKLLLAGVSTLKNKCLCISDVETFDKSDKE